MLTKKIIQNNEVIVCGKIASDVLYSHETSGKKFYTSDIKIMRLSERHDMIRLTIPEKILKTISLCNGAYVKVTGQFRSYNMMVEDKSRLILTLFVTGMEILNEFFEWDYENTIYLDGYLCKPPVYRQTPNRTEVTNLLIATNRNYGMSCYIPCICWANNARHAKKFNIGDRFKIKGRIQSKEYTKNYPDGTTEQRVAYEVSIQKIIKIQTDKGVIHVHECI